MRREEMIVPVKIDRRWSLNEVYAGQSWHRRKKQADEIHETVGWLCRGKKRFLKPVKISMWFHCRLDIDNCSYAAKLIIDGLRHGDLLVDDSPNYVRGLSLSFWDGNGVRVLLEEDENG